MGNALRVVQLGVGDFGKTWLDVLNKHPAVRLAGVVSSNAARYPQLQAQTGLDAACLFPTLGDALKRCDFDLLVNVTPPAVHRATTVMALEGGVHVLCEKPAAESAEEADAMLAAARRCGHTLAIGENYRFFPAMRRAQALLRQGAVGALEAVDIRFARRHVMNNYHSRLRHPLLLDVAVHHFDCLRFLAGDEPAGMALAGPPDFDGSAFRGVRLDIPLAGGALAHYSGTLDAARDETGWLGEWTLRGAKGSLHLTERCCTLTPAGGAPRDFPCPAEDGSLASLLGDVAAAIREGRPPETDLEDNRRSLGISLRAIGLAESWRKEG